MPELVEWLATLSAEALAAVLVRRPDAVAPPIPESLAELAERLGQPMSVGFAVAELPLPALQLAEVMAGMGGGCGREDLAAVLGRPSHALDDTLRALAEVALVWPAHGGARLGSVDLRGVWPMPLGLGPSVAELLAGLPAPSVYGIAGRLGLTTPRRKGEAVAAVGGWLSDPDNVRAVVEQAPPRVRSVLREIGRTDPVVPVWGTDAHAWGRERGLLLGDGAWPGTLVMPREVASALRGPEWHPPFDPGPPAVPTAGVSGDAVDRDAAVAATAAVAGVTEVLAECSRRPAALRKSGGVSARELRRLAKATGDTETRVRFWLDLAYAADLVAPTDDGIAPPTARFDAWRARQPADALVDLLDGWRELECAPLYPAEPIRPALLWPGNGVLARHLRQVVLAAAADLPPDTGIADPADLVPAIRWRRPMVADDLEDLDSMVRALWQEAELLGAVAHGTATTLGRALDIPDRLHAEASRLLPPAEAHARFQADLTAVVAGPPDGELAALQDLAADREARGTASVWRFTPGSVRDALDAGATADVLLERLRAVAVGGVLPQPLEYLIGDVARRHGRVRVRPVGCCLRSDDTALLAEIRATRSLAKLGLSMLAPTVLASGRPVAETLDALRAAGYAPVAEDPDEAPMIERITRTRAEPGRPAAPAPAASNIRSLSAALQRAGLSTGPADTRTLAVLRERAPQLAGADVRILARAVDEGIPVYLEYVNAQGNESTRVIEKATLDGGTLFGWCTLRQADRYFSVRRIRAVAPAPPAS